MKNTYKLAFAAMMAAGLVGCGKEEPKPAPKAEAPAAPAEPSVTVKIAHAGPLTVKTPHLGKDDENGVALALAQANEQKIKIDGKLVKFVMQSEDDQGDPKVGTTVAQKAGRRQGCRGRGRPSQFGRIDSRHRKSTSRPASR